MVHSANKWCQSRMQRERGREMEKKQLKLKAKIIKL